MAVALPADTLLVITGAGLTPFSARGLRQTLDPIAAAKSQLHRTVNGKLINLTPSQFQLYKTLIECTDLNAPALDGVWPGTPVAIDCVVEWSYPTIGGAPQRAVVAGSSRVDGDYTFYRPHLAMMVTDFQVVKNEWGAEIGWKLDAEETP